MESFEHESRLRMPKREPDQDGNNRLGNVSHRRKEEIEDKELWEDKEIDGGAWLSNDSLRVETF
jgi:hypothetical protein